MDLALGLSLVCAQTVEQRCELVLGGATESLFPRASSLLDQICYQRALKYVSGRKNMNRYRSMMDYLFCEYFIGYRSSCLSFYKGEGPPLAQVETCQETLTFFDSRLCDVLESALHSFGQQERMSWESFRVALIAEAQLKAEAMIAG